MRLLDASSEVDNCDGSEEIGEYSDGTNGMAPMRVLVISHSAQATGAPIALLRIMRWCVAHRILQPFFVVRDGGELIESFEALGPTVHVSALTEHRVRKVAASFLNEDRARNLTSYLSRYRLRYICWRYKVQAVYVNTATQSDIVAPLHQTGLPIITHVHELERVLRRTVGAAGIKAVIDQSHTLVAVSSAVRTMLLAHGAESTRVIDIPEPIVNDGCVSADDRDVMRRTVFGVDGDTTLVLACGLPSWRKGTDVFLQVAKDVIARAANDSKVAFRWLGGTLPNIAMTTLIDDIACLGLEEHVAVIPHMPDAERLLAAADVLVSTSREDPNPLVVLEAASRGCPVVCFQGAGGSAELARVGGAMAVPYLDITAMASAVAALIDSPAERASLGDAGRRIVRETNDPDKVAKKIGMVIRRCVMHM